MDHESGAPERTFMADGTSPDELVDEGFYAWLAVWKAQVVVARTLERDIREHTGLPLTACEVLSRLGAAPGGRLRMQELARQVFVSKSGISQLVSQLSRQGLVERQGDPDNLRVTYAVLTDKARQSFPEHAPVFLGGVRRYFSQHLTDDEARTVTQAMNKVIRALGHEPESHDQPEAVENLHRLASGDAAAPET